MGVGWSSTFYVGCKWLYDAPSPSLLFMDIVLIEYRLCLDRLAVVQESDHTALVTRVFWKCVLTPIISPMRLNRSTQIPPDNAAPPINLLARTSWVSWRLGPRWLSLLTLPLGSGATSRFVRHDLGLHTELTDPDSVSRSQVCPSQSYPWSRDCRRTCKGLHLLLMYSIHKFGSYQHPSLPLSQGTNSFPTRSKLPPFNGIPRC